MNNDHQLLTNKQLEILLKAGPELDRVAPQLSPELQQVLMDLQRNAADAYAAGTWQVEATGETITVPDIVSRKIKAEAPSFIEQAQYALGSAYLDISAQSKNMLKSVMENLGLTPSAPAFRQDRGQQI